MKNGLKQIWFAIKVDQNNFVTSVHPLKPGNMKTILSIIACMILCSSFNHKGHRVQLRFKNSTGKDFTELKVWTIDGDIIVHDFKNGAVSKAFSVSSSYKIAHSTAITSTGTFTTPGLCHSGEKLYTEGDMLMEFILTSQTFTNGPKENPYLFVKTTIDNRDADLTKQ